MKINYVTIANESLASFRYNILTPARELAKMGHKIFITKYPVREADAYIFHKHLRYFEPEIVVELKKEETGKVYFIICDYHLDTRHKDHYLNMIGVCDRIVTCTHEMRRLLIEEINKDSTVIKDPWGVEFPWVNPSFKKKDRYNILWFGNRTNLDSLIPAVPQLGEHKLTLVTDKGAEKIFDSIRDQVNYVPYTPDAVNEEMAKCDICILPQDVTIKRKNVKTHNRLVDTIKSGKFAIASPIDAYKELADFCYLGEIKDGLKWLDTVTEEEVNDRIEKGQDYISKEFSPTKIASDWDRLLRG